MKAYVLLSLAVLTSLLPVPSGAAERTARQRLELERLKAVHATRERFKRERTIAHVPNHGLYRDFRAILNLRVDPQQKEALLKAAKEAGVQVLLINGAAATETHDGILCLSGAEDENGVLSTAGPPGSRKLRFYPAFERVDADDSVHAGVTVLDGLREFVRLGDALKQQTTTDEARARLLAAFKQYPDEIYAAASDYRADVWEFYDSVVATRRAPAIAADGAPASIKIAGESVDLLATGMRHLTTHLMARDESEAEIRTALRHGRAYVAHDWLCDPTGFAFAAFNNLGLHNLGDKIPHYSGNTRLIAFSPLKGRIKLFHNGVKVQETVDIAMTYFTQKEGAYRVEVWLDVDGEERPWIYSNPIYVEGPTLGSITSLMYPAPDPSKVTAEKDIPYIEKPVDEAKQKLDVFVPKEAKKPLPVLFFIHGGAWRFGDKSLYFGLGNRFASEGILCVIPGYRLAPKYPHPAQIEDVAAAFAWTVKNIEQYGGDPKRIYVAGHSAGGHLCSLLTLDEKHLKKHGLSPDIIKGTITHSGVYDLIVIGDSQSSVFGKDEAVRRDASPLFHVRKTESPFVVGYCQWDYPTLPAQAIEFEAKLREKGVKTELIYVPNENHISEMLSILNDKDPMYQAVIRFIK